MLGRPDDGHTRTALLESCAVDRVGGSIYERMRNGHNLSSVGYRGLLPPMPLVGLAVRLARPSHVVSISPSAFRIRARDNPPIIYEMLWYGYGYRSSGPRDDDRLEIGALIVYVRVRGRGRLKT